MDIFLCLRSRLKICSRETGSAVLSHVSLLLLHTQAESGAYSRDSSRFPRRRPFIYLKRRTPWGQSRVYRVTQSRTDDVPCQESAGTWPVVLKVVPVTGAAFAGHRGLSECNLEGGGGAFRISPKVIRQEVERNGGNNILKAPKIAHLFLSARDFLTSKQRSLRKSNAPAVNPLCNTHHGGGHMFHSRPGICGPHHISTFYYLLISNATMQITTPFYPAFSTAESRQV